MKTVLSIILLLSLNFASKAQSSVIDSLPPQEYLDFWVGNWNLTWTDPDGSTAKGHNTIEKILSGKVIKENFEGLTGQNRGYIGKSWSVYNPRTEQWKQTWVDNQGGYLDFIGSIDGEKRIFKRKAVNPKGKTVLQRMVFDDITEDSFIWNWESSVDEGQTWKLLWQIVYSRE